MEMMMVAPMTDSTADCAPSPVALAIICPSITWRMYRGRVKFSRLFM